MYALWTRRRGGGLSEKAVGEEDARPETRIAADIAAAQVGDAAAMERLLLPYARMLRSLCLGMLGNTADADDAVQETFLQALSSLGRFQGKAKFSTWLAQIAVHVCADQKRKRRPHVSLEDWFEESLGVVASRETPEQRTIDRLLAREALLALRPDRRAAFLLRQMEGWSIEEIGQAMGWSVPRVKTELYRARRAMGDWLRRREENEGRAEGSGQEKKP